MDRNDVIQTALLHAEQLRGLLQSGGAPAPSDCAAMLNDLDSLRECAGKDRETEETAMSIDELFQDFTQYAEDSKLRLQEMLALISAGKAPPQESVAELDASITCLRDRYAALYQSAQSQLPEGEMPGETPSAAELVEAVQNSRTLRLKRQIHEVEDCLKRFLSVRSPAAAYADDLLPYQQQAADLLASIRAGTVETDDLEERIAGPRTFLAALECEDKDSGEGLALCDRVEEFFRGRIHTGVVAGKYLIEPAGDADGRPSEGPESSLKPPSAGSDVGPEPPVAPVGQAEEVGFAPAGTGPADTGEPSDGAETESEGSENAHADSAFVQTLRDRGCFIASDGDFGHMLAEENPSEGRKITSSIFTNEMRDGILAVERDIIQALGARNFLSLRLLTDVMKISAKPAEATVSYLLRKGYLRRYGVSPGGEFYCASLRLMRALTFLEPCRRIGVRRRALSDWDQPIPNRASSIASRVAVSELYTSIKSYFAERGGEQYVERIGMMTDAFYGLLFDKDHPSGGVLFLGTFWTEGSECDRFLENVRRLLEDCAGLSGVVVAGLGLPHAGALAGAVLEALGGPALSAPVQLYALAENAYYLYPSLKPAAETEPLSGVVSAEPPEPEEESASPVPTPAELEEAEEEPAAGIPPEEPAPELAKEPDEPEPAIPERPEPKLPPEPAAREEPRPTRQVPLDEVRENTCRMLCDQQFYAAAAYLKSLSPASEDTALLYTQLAYALNDPLGRCGYSTDHAFQLISKPGILEHHLDLAISLRTFFSNQVRYDYTIKSFYATIKDSPLLGRYSALSNVLYTLADFKDTQKKGLDAYADYHARSRTELDRQAAALQKEADVFYNNFVAGHKKEKCRQKQFIETKTIMFSVGSDLGQYLKAVVDGDTELKPLAEAFLQEHFYDAGSVIAEDTIDGERLETYIQDFWEKAAVRLKYKHHEPLKSRLLSNITNEATKAVQLLARWCGLVERMSGQSVDDGASAYKKVRDSLRTNLDDARNAVTAAMGAAPSGSEERAGLAVLEHALADLFACIDGSFSENERKYFYAPFLLTGDVPLGEDFMPDFDVHSSALTALLPDQRILAHTSALKQSKPDYLDRLAEILNEGGDDYGSARQLTEYLSAVRPELDLSEFTAQIEEGESFAGESARIAQSDFIGELELAQSYGQIDNSVENRKEMILQIVDEWYEWAQDTGNYGFFRRVMAAYLQDIKDSSKGRERDLSEQLEKYRTEMIPGLSAEARAARIARIQEMIRAQNYTVAEDLLARFSMIEDENDGRIEEDFLKEFLDNYDDYYVPVAKHSMSFSSLVSSRTRNKEERGAKRLADSWLPGGSPLGPDRLRALLSSLGFRVDMIRSQNPIGRFENYSVKTLSAENGKRANYTHPIAAFGSGAALEGFRVVCINGTYGADGLIDIIKEIGNAKHTLILLDSALSKSERRRLARKTKNALGDKLFAVLDRTVMMYLVRNFDENRINRMLVSLIMPFSYYQPYVWDSANVMPPEIFMGRKKELERIKSPTGVNIVYGGRQLGKSALLKKAKEDIDQDENGDRAVYVEIKSLNYKEAARKIGHELYDQFILEEDIDTTDWSELARAVKRRLQSPKSRIPYLLLLLDEADAFIESCEVVNYQPFDALKDIQSIGAGRFKFVIAGLRNVVRFKREAALGKNSVLTHLQSMTVTPFNTPEARELLEIPLHYLGLRFPKEKEALITLILATTNYFPGMIQLYCAKLLEAMRSKDYAGYGEVDSPIYEVSEGHIKKVLADPSFTQQIREKFEITLKLDEDNYYYLIALLMAYLYHNNGYSAGYSAADIKRVGTEFGIARIAALEETKLAAFMEELKELNVLRNTDQTHYLFTRVAFFQMMGTSAEVDDKLEEYMDG